MISHGVKRKQKSPFNCCEGVYSFCCMEQCH